MPSWIVLSWALTCGWLPMSGTCVVSATGVNGVGYLNAVSSKLEIQADIWQHARIFGSMETRETLSLDPSLGLFSPYEAYFVAGAALYAKGIEIGIIHECDHGIESSSDFIPWISSGGTEVYIKISGKTQ